MCTLYNDAFNKHHCKPHYSYTLSKSQGMRRHNFNICSSESIYQLFFEIVNYSSVVSDPIGFTSSKTFGDLVDGFPHKLCIPTCH